jgi:hypothetical protein
MMSLVKKRNEDGHLAHLPRFSGRGKIEVDDLAFLFSVFYSKILPYNAGLQEMKKLTILIP